MRLYSTAYNIVQYITEQYSTAQNGTVQYNSTVQYSAVQYSTVQYSTVQYSTEQYSTIHPVFRWVARRERNVTSHVFLSNQLRNLVCVICLVSTRPETFQHWNSHDKQKQIVTYMCAIGELWERRVGATAGVRGRTTGLVTSAAAPPPPVATPPLEDPDAARDLGLQKIHTG